VIGAVLDRHRSHRSVRFGVFGAAAWQGHITPGLRPEAKERDMIEWLKYQYGVRKLHRKERQVSRQYGPKILEAGKQNKQDELRGWVDEHKRERELVEDERCILEHTYWVRKADRRLFPRPRFDGEYGSTWVESKRWPGNVYLSREAISELRAMIRKDTKERLELISPLTGLVGALTGLIAVIGSVL
jgi:hypothetical protein